MTATVNDSPEQFSIEFNFYNYIFLVPESNLPRVCQMSYHLTLPREQKFVSKIKHNPLGTDLIHRKSDYNNTLKHYGESMALNLRPWKWHTIQDKEK